MKGTRLTLTLDEAQKADVVEASKMLHAIFVAYPDLSVPRTRTIEKISERLTEAKIASLKAGFSMNHFDDDEMIESKQSFSPAYEQECRFSPFFGGVGGPFFLGFAKKTN